MCTFFRYKTEEENIVGKNYDVPNPCYGLIFWNLAGIKKEALMKPPEKPAEWTSKYGSLTFNQVGRDFPAGGINETGLVVEQTSLWNTIYPDRDKRDAITELQLIQYLLDTCSTVDEVIEKLNHVRVAQENAKLQYIISDKSGSICLVEFILGDMNIYREEDIKYDVISNDMLQTCLDYLNIHKGYGGEKNITPSQYSIDRFVVTVDAIQKLKEQDDQSNFFSVLNASKNDETQWQIVYDIDEKSVTWKTNLSDDVHYLFIDDLKDEKKCIMFELDGSEKSDYDRLKNKELVTYFFRESNYFKLLKISDSELDKMAEHPEKFI